MGGATGRGGAGIHGARVSGAIGAAASVRGRGGAAEAVRAARTAHLSERPGGASGGKRRGAGRARVLEVLGPRPAYVRDGGRRSAARVRAAGPVADGAGACGRARARHRAALHFFRLSPTESADGFGREAALPAPDGRPEATGVSTQRVGPRLAPEGDSAASGRTPRTGT